MRFLRQKKAKFFLSKAGFEPTTFSSAGSIANHKATGDCWQGKVKTQYCFILSLRHQKIFCTRTRKFMYLTDQNGMESFVPDVTFLFSAALGWAVASVAFQASFLVENGRHPSKSGPRMKPGRPQKPQPSPVQR